MPNDSLTNFANVLYTEALKEKERVAKELQSEREKTLAKKDAELNKKYKRDLKERRAGFEYEIRLVLSRREAELSSALRQNRTRVAEEVFEAAAASLIEFTSSDKYEKYLKNEFDEIAKEFSEGTTVCTARECDEELIKKVCPIKNIVFAEAKDDIIGGFTLKNTELEIFADCTLVSKLEEQKKIFYKKSGLTID